jgi:hypothetical protein
MRAGAFAEQSTRREKNSSELNWTGEMKRRDMLKAGERGGRAGIAEDRPWRDAGGERG